MVKLRAILRAGALGLGLLTAAASLAALSAAESDLNEEKFGTMVRDYLLKHPEVLREVIDALDKKEKAAEKQAVANARSLAGSIEPFYGAAAKDTFFKLLAGHYGAIKAYLGATVAADAAGQSTATQSLTSNADDMASIASADTPCVGGGKLAATPSPYRIVSGSTHVDRCTAKSSRASGLPARETSATMRCARSPR